MKRMLINATQEEELRVAMVDGQRLYDLNIEGPASERKKANIYKGKITRIEPSLEAAFVDYGAERHGFLPLKEISSEYFVKDVDGGGKPNIREVLKEGQDIVVQIDKEERGNKGAALTTFVSLAGRFIVLKPNKARSGGVSRRIVGDDRDLARQSLSGVEVPKGMSVILRTAGIDRNPEELAWDLENLLAVWQAILNVVLQRPSPFLIYRESNAVVRALRDYMTDEIGEILVDDQATYDEAREFVEQVMPHNLRKLKLYTDAVPLFTRFQIESQIESAFAHSVTLPSGGSIVIDHTEALVSIDINSARATKGGDIEATALSTNVEAAEEIARQLRIRDLGGLIVIDFIDMGPQKNQREVENRLREAVRQDRARVQIGKITRFGLLEMSRQRLRPSLGESSYQTCPRCSGFGTIRSVESLALAILRIVGEEARKERTAKVIAQLPVEVATYLLNEKRDWVQSVETRHDTQVVLVANSALETPHYDVRRVRDDQVDLPENAGVSYELAERDPEPEMPESMQERQPAEEAAIGKIAPVSPAPQRKPEPATASSTGIIASLISLFRGSPETEEEQTRKKASTRPARRRKGTAEPDRARSSRKRTRRRGDSRSDDGSAGNRQGRKKQAKKARSQDKPNKDSGKAADRKADSAKSEDAQKDSRKPSRRRSRGGRRRKRGGERQARDAQSPQAADQQPKQDAKNAADSKPSESPKPESPSEVRKPETKGELRPESKPEAKAEPRPESKPEAKAEPRPESKPETKAEPRPESKPETKAEPGPESKPETKSEPKPEPKSGSRPEAKPEPSPEPKSGSRPEAKPEPSPEPKAGPKESKSGNGSNGDKPDGRLLPWEPVASPADGKEEKPPQQSQSE